MQPMLIQSIRQSNLILIESDADVVDCTYDNPDAVHGIVDEWFADSSPLVTQSIEQSSSLSYAVAMDGRTDVVQINQVVRIGVQDEGTVEARQIDFEAPFTPTGSVILGGSGDDRIQGKAGWDLLHGGAGDDFIRAGNGRDILTGGAGCDELWGDHGWNTYTPERDGSADLFVVKSDQWLVNWLSGTAGNNPNGEKCDVIQGADAFDQIRIVGVFRDDLTFQAQASAHGLTGIGIYAKGALEVLYTGGDLSVEQIQAMTTADG